MKEQMRAEFEAWFKKEHLSMMAHAKFLECWQAALSAVPNHIPDVGEMVQPAQEPTYEDHDTAKHHDWLKKVETENDGKANELICDVSAQEPASIKTTVERIKDATGAIVDPKSDYYSDHFKAEIAELRAALEGQTQRANALALVINDLTKMVTHDAETKQQFIERVKSILSVDPDLRVSKFESALQAGNAEQARRIAEVKEVIDQSNALDKYEIIERISGVLSAQKGTE